MRTRNYDGRSFDLCKGATARAWSAHFGEGGGRGVTSRSWVDLPA
jgi:hypothetical protein